jgi:flagellar L-ring protein FlgH
MRKYIIMSQLWAGMTTAIVLGQQSSDARPTRNVAAQPTANLNGAPPNIGQLMRASNGSLHRATAAMPDDPRLVRPGDVSYFSIAAPRPKTLVKNDLVTIIVREESSYSSDSSADASKDASLDARIEQFPKVDLSNFALTAGIGATIPQFKISGTREYKNEGQTDRSDKLTARLQAEVVDVKPNGTLVLQARKRIVTDEDEQLFVLTGICRVQDVTADNSVLSTQLYDLDVKKTHSGPVRDAVKRGWLPRAMDWINPF